MEPIKVVLCVKPRVYLGLILLVLGAIGATSEPAVAHDDSDLLCKGSIVTYLVLRIKQMIHRRLARYPTYRPRPRSDRLNHLIASEHQ